MPFAPLESAAKLYRKLLAPVGSYLVNIHLRDGLPEQFSEPLSFLFRRALVEADQKVTDKVEAIRQTIADSSASYKPVSSGLDVSRTSTETAFVSSITPEWGIFLYLCAKSFNVQTIPVYIDGPKEYEPTMKYLRKIIPKLNSGRLVIFDGIHWSHDMWQMWQTVCRWPGFAYTVNAGRFGLGLWQDGSIQPINVDLSILTGWLRVKKGYE